MQMGGGPAAGAPEGTSQAVAAGDAGWPLTLPSASFIADGRFVRVGADLRITDADGNEVVVQGYFAGDAPPDLLAPDGTQILTPGLVESFLTPLAPGQYAQAAPSAAAAAIGQVLDLNGEAFAMHADGTRVQLAKGDSVFEGDVVETGGGDSAIRMVFTDKTEFSLGTDARLALDQLVFNPDTQSGSAQFSVLKGVFIFASGQIAKTDNTDMTVTTPVATVGIRGTEVAGRVVDGDSQFTIIDGAIEVTTRAGSVTLDERGETTQVAGNDMPPSDPFILTPAQFGQAYGEVAGVVSSYFSQPQPDAPGTAPGGGGTPSEPGGGSPDSSPSGSDDRADAGTAPGDVMLASALPSDGPTVAGLADPLSFATAFSGEPATGGDTASASLFSVPPVGQSGTVAENAGVSASYGGGFLAGAVPEGAAAQTGSAPAGSAQGPAPGVAEEIVIAAVPGLSLAENITFGGQSGAEQTAGPAGFSLAPSGDVAGVTGAGTSDGGIAGQVQVSFSPLPGIPGNAGESIPAIADGSSSDSLPLDMPSTGSSGSPFRSESGASDPFAGNPYIAQPFGYAGPQLGDAVFALVNGGSSESATAATSAVVGDDPFSSAIARVEEVTAPTTATVTPAAPAAPTGPADITLTVSNAAQNQQYQDLTNSYELPNLGAGSFVFVGQQLHGVGNGARIELQRDGAGNVEVELASAWNSVKNIRAESETAADIRIDNFVHADVHFGNGGDSEITIIGAKRGFVTTGDGDDAITIEAVSNGAGWSHRFDLRAGAGDDLVVFDGASDGLSELFFDGGAGTDTLRLTGPGQSFDLSTGQVRIAGVERIDISGAGNATLSLPSTLFDGLAAAINPLTETAQTLVVDGDAGDTLDLQGDDWTPAGTADIDGHGYSVYEHSTGMRVAADSDLQVV